METKYTLDYWIDDGWYDGNYWPRMLGIVLSKFHL
jgi:hypothetical protein